ncbi:MAG TPA: thermonuclease family protein [Croceibacterium sp.]|nr:thermonuclease family protein [Croceibacterium sp.]
MARRPPSVIPFRRKPRWARGGGHGEVAWTEPGRLKFRDRARPRQRRRRLRIAPIMVMAPLAVFTAVFVWGFPPALPLGFDRPPPTALDRETARFALCAGRGAAGGDCVIDGDTFWYAGEKIRLADINTPETSAPECAREAELGAAATARLRALLNAGPFTLGPAASGDDRDRYGRRLRTVTRDGERLGAVLVGEGLAEEWRGIAGAGAERLRAPHRLCCGLARTPRCASPRPSRR